MYKTTSNEYKYSQKYWFVLQQSMIGKWRVNIAVKSIELGSRIWLQSQFNNNIHI